MFNKITYNSIAGQRSQRMEALSDGVFSIALTLLVLDIKVGIDTGIKTEKELLGLFLSLTPKILSYFMSFITLGMFWVAHSTQHFYITKSNRHLNWISLFFLLFVSLVPFTTAFLSEYIDFKLSIGIYWLNILALGMGLIVHWEYALKYNLINLPKEEIAEVTHVIKKRIIVAEALYTMGALLCFVSTYLSIFVITIIQLNYAIGPFIKAGKLKS